MKKILVNACHNEEKRIAIIEDGKIIDLDIDCLEKEQKKSNIYRAKISRIEPSLNAMFVNYGEEKNGFLPYKEIAPNVLGHLYQSMEKDDCQSPIDKIEVGSEIIVQISKEARANKGAALTNFITLAGCYMVLMPNNPNAGGISRRVENKDRQVLKQLLDSLIIPENMGVIIRTAGVNCSFKELKDDLDTLLKLWKSILGRFNSNKGTFLIHKESDIVVRTIRDYLKNDISEIIVDTKDMYNSFKHHLSILRPDFTESLSFYRNKKSLFDFYKIERQYENIFRKEIRLSSGGSIVFDTTEALTSIDINSSKSNKADNIEDTALLTNLEASLEISHQLRLRDISGLVIIDFIDMSSLSNQKDVENKLIEALSKDKAKIQMTRISKFGLVEISRQRLKSSVSESTTDLCTSCNGSGRIRSIPSLALSILRNLKSEVIRDDKINEISLTVVPDLYNFFSNMKRFELYKIETEFDLRILLYSQSNMPLPYFRIEKNNSNYRNDINTSPDSPNMRKKFGPARVTKNNIVDLTSKKIFHHSLEDSKINKRLCDVLKSLFSIMSNFFVCSYSRIYKLVKLIKSYKFKEKKISYSNRSYPKDNIYNKNNTKRNQSFASQKKSKRSNNGRFEDNSKENKHQSKNSTRSHSFSRFQVHNHEELIDVSVSSNSSKKVLEDLKYQKNSKINDKEQINNAVKEELSRSSSLKNDDVLIQVDTLSRNSSSKNRSRIVDSDFQKEWNNFINNDCLPTKKTFNSVDLKNDIDSLNMNEDLCGKKIITKKKKDKTNIINYSVAFDSEVQGFIKN